MSAADDVRSILKDAGVPMTRKQILDALPEGTGVGAVDVFLATARKQGKIKATVEDGKAHYTPAEGFAPAPRSPKAKPAAKRARAETKTDPSPRSAAPLPLPSPLGAPSTLPVIAPKPALQRMRDHAENALNAYLDSVVDHGLYDALIAARDAAERACRNAAP